MKTTNEPMVHKPSITSLYEEVTNRIIAMIEKGVAPWRKPWTSFGLARNYVSGRIYTGINYILMNNTEHFIPYFLTFKQVKELGGKIRKGAAAEKVVYYMVYHKDLNDNALSPEEASQSRLKGEEIKVLRFLRYYSVFNVEDIEGAELDLNRFKEVKLTDNQRIIRCEEILHKMPNPPAFKQIDPNRAFYSLKGDYINLPDIKQFESSFHFYSVCFHELLHSTGYVSRLNRPEVMNGSSFGTIKYSSEELLAEIGASFLNHHCQIDTNSVIENSASYLKGWLDVLKEDPKYIFKISAEAQKAVNLIIGAH